MNRGTREFRRSRIGVLEFLRDPVQQRAFAGATKYDDYASEFLSWWLDDFYPESAMFQAAFTTAEIGVLSALTQTLAGVDAKLGARRRTVDELIATPEWHQVGVAASAALAALAVGAT
jgi:hypothetical protein